MYNKKSKISAILAIITAALLIGFMILLPFLQYKQGEGDNLGTAFALILIIIYGYPLLYVGTIPFSIVGLIFGIKMLKQQSRKKLISLNVRMLITTCVLLPVIAVGLMFTSSIIFHSTLGLFPSIYIVVASLAYVAGLVTQIVTIVLLKKSPEESVPNVSNNN